MSALPAELKARIKTPQEIVDKMTRDFQRYVELDEMSRTIGLLPEQRREWIKLRARRACVKI